MDIYDVAITNALLADPENKSITRGNIGICGGKICRITSDSIKGNLELDAKGHVASPGFIDIHAHIDGDSGCGRLSLIQGVTTTIGGNCGGGPLDIENFLHSQDKNGFWINQAQFVGHSFSLRQKVGITSPYRAASDRETALMAEFLEKAFLQGAIGLSLGLEYAPGSSFQEIIALSRIAAERNRIVSIHTRLTGPNELESLKEAIKISEITGARVQVSHLVYQYGTGIMTQALEMIDEARSRGLDVWCDSGMYTNFATGINTSVYDREHMNKFGWKYSNMLVASGEYKGQYLTESIYKKLRNENLDAVIICFTGIENEIYEALLNRYVVPSSDTGPSPSGNIQEGHPQNSGTFPRFFSKMVREKKLLSLIEAIKKATLVPAKILGFENKGRLREGCDADIVVFSPQDIRDTSDFERPAAIPEGIDYVLVNGKLSVENGSIKEQVKSGKTIKPIR